MTSQQTIMSIACVLAVVATGVVLLPFAFPGRVALGVTLAGEGVTGLSESDLAGALATIESHVLDRSITLTLDGVAKVYTLREVGVHLNISETIQALRGAPRWGILLHPLDVAPSITFDDRAAQTLLSQDLAPHVQLPRDATLRFNAAGALVVVASAPGQQIDVLALEQDITQAVRTSVYAPIALRVMLAPASIQADEVALAQQTAQQLLTDGFTLAFADTEYVIKPPVVRRLLQFVPRVDPTQPKNEILGVAFDGDALRSYVTETVASQVNKLAINARFELAGDRVERFALPEQGQEVDIEATIAAVKAAVAAGGTQASLAVLVTEPDVGDAAAITNVGVTKLLAEGETSFAGSPRNRVHNITVGAARFHGLLIAPGEEFSFDKYLGPVNAETGYKPELVIKENVTKPEFGGGLCQVSTTAFRAALYSGLKITARRNHAYAVRYYGTPGFDATIYPPYTDLRFLNNTPGYILIQTRIEGTRLIFDFWGTDDGRVVEVDGPHPYNRQPNGAVKAVLRQTVRKDGQPFIEDTFYSNYKSPQLFPHVTSTPAPSPSPQNQDAPLGSPAPAAQT